MSVANNIIAFPKENIRNNISGGPVQTVEDVEERVQAVHQIHIDNVLDGIVQTIIQQLIVGGFDVEEEESQGVAFIAEGLRAIMSEQYGIAHPFQDVIMNTMFEDGDGVYQVAEGIIITSFENEEDYDKKLEAIKEVVEDGPPDAA